MRVHRIRIAEGLVLGLAVVLRVLAAWSVNQTGHARHPLVDAHTYWSQATTLANGGNPFPDGFYQPPGYPLVLSWLQQVGASDLWGPRLLQLGLGLLTTACLMYVGRRLGGSERPWFGAVAGFLYTVYPTTLLFELDLLTPAITSFITVTLLLLVRPQGSFWRFGLAACLAGLASGLHPSFLIVSFAIGVVACLRATKPLPAVTCSVVGLLVGLIPMTQANIDLFQQTQFTSNNAGINFYMGNNPDWKRTAFLRPGLQFRQMALEAEPHKRDGFERNDYWMSRAWSEIAAEPHQWLVALTTKAVWSVSDTEIPRNEDYRCRTRSGPMGWLDFSLVRYGLVFPLALLGALVAWRRRPEARFAVLAWVALHLPVVLFIVADRYRMATWPMMCVLAPFGLDAVRNVRTWGRNRIILLGVAVILPWLPLDEKTAEDPAWCAHIEGNLAYMDGDMNAAEAAYMDAVRLDPSDWSAQNWLAQTLAKRGEVPQALEHLEVILAGFPDSFPTLRTAAGLKARSGDYAGGAELMLRAYAVPGERTNTGIQALRLLYRSGQKERARELLEQDKKLAKKWARSR